MTETLLNHLRRRVEEDRPVCPVIGNTSRAESGDAFVTFRSSTKEEGEVGDGYPTTREACDAFLKAFREYAVGKDGWALYWRHLPEFVYDDGLRFDFNGPQQNEPPTWRVYARLVLSELKDDLHQRQG